VLCCRRRRLLLPVCCSRPELAGLALCRAQPLLQLRQRAALRVEAAAPGGRGVLQARQLALLHLLRGV
jgi:hypothetical protein